MKPALVLVAVALGYAALYALLFLPLWMEGRVLAPDEGRFGDDPAAVLGRVLGLPYGAFIVLALVIASTSCFFLARRLTGSTLGAAVAGVTYGACAFMIGHVGNAALVHTACWFPLVFLGLVAIDMGVRSSAPWFAATVGATCLMFLGGNLQIAVYGSIVAVAYVTFLANRGRLRVAALALGLGIGAAAIRLIPDMLLHQQTPVYGDFAAGAMRLQNLLFLFFPYFEGGPGPPFARYENVRPLREIASYVGLLPLALAAVAVFTRRREREIRFWTVVAVVAVLLAVGDQTPLGRLSYLVPLINQFGNPSRHLFEFSLALALLAAHGVAAVQATDARRRKRLGLLAAFAIAAPVLGYCVRLLVAPPLWSPVAVAIPILVLVGAVGGVLSWTRWTGPWTGAALVGMCCVDLASFGLFADWRYSSPRPQDIEPPPLLRTYGDRALGKQGRIVPSVGAEPHGLPLPWMLLGIGKPPSSSEWRYRALLRERAQDASWLGALLRVRYGIVTRQDLVRKPDPQDLKDLTDPDLGLVMGSASAPGAVQETVVHVPGVVGTHLVQVSKMFGAPDIEIGLAVLELTAEVDGGARPPLYLRVGRDTGEHSWAPKITPEAVRLPGGAYTSRLALGGRGRVGAIRLRWVSPEPAPGIGLRLEHLKIQDDTTGTEALLPRILVEGTHPWKLAEARPEALVYQNQRVLPPAWIVWDVRQLAFEDLARALIEGALPAKVPFDPRRTALVEDTVACCKTLGEGTATVLGDTGTEMRIATSATAAGFLVTSRSAWRGPLPWRAWIDGFETPMVQANGVLVGLPIPKGRHTVRILFGEPGLTLGAILSALSLLAAGGAAVSLWRRT